MAKNLEIQIEEKKPKFPKNLLLLLPKLPFNTKRSVEVVIEKKPNEKQLGDGGNQISKNNKPAGADVVKFSEPRPAVPPPLTLEADDTGTTPNKLILWQVYAVGGIFLLKWIWARWKGRKEMGSKKESADEDEKE